MERTENGHTGRNLIFRSRTVYSESSCFRLASPLLVPTEAQGRRSASPLSPSHSRPASQSAGIDSATIRYSYSWNGKTGTASHMVSPVRSQCPSIPYRNGPRMRSKTLAAIFRPTTRKTGGRALQGILTRFFWNDRWRSTPDLHRPDRFQNRPGLLFPPLGVQSEMLVRHPFGLFPVASEQERNP